MLRDLRFGALNGHSTLCWVLGIALFWVAVTFFFIIRCFTPWSLRDLELNFGAHCLLCWVSVTKEEHWRRFDIFCQNLYKRAFLIYFLFSRAAIWSLFTQGALRVLEWNFGALNGHAVHFVVFWGSSYLDRQWKINIIAEFHQFKSQQLQKV